IEGSSTIGTIRNRFFNGNDLGSKKATWIKWSNVLADKAKGVLNTSLWVRVVKAIHGEDRKVGQNISSRSYSCWLNIVKEKDNWINGGVLKDVFPRLYALEMRKKVEVETASHLFFKCSLVRQIARKVYSWWNVDYVDANSYEEWLDWMCSLRLPAKLKLMLEGVFYVVWWYIWNIVTRLSSNQKPH
nr:RNA-directed DNA polymerase, eukaryota [Tanacetum cinerariifolium]